MNTEAAVAAAEPGRSPGISPARWLALGMVLALLVRMIPASFPSFWYDEFYTLSISRFSPARILHITYYKDVHPPVYYLLIHGLMRLGDVFGGIVASQFFLRMASVGFGLAACWLMHRAARAYWGEGAGRAALLLAAFAPALVNFSIELRDYALVILLILTATLTLLEVVRRGGWQPRLAAGYVALMTLALYTHSLSFLYLFGHGVLVLAELALRRDRARTLLPQALAAAGAVLALHAPWLMSFFQDEKLTFRGFDFLAFARPADLLPAFFYYPFFGFISELFRWGGMPLAGLIAVMLASGVCGAAAWHGTRRAKREGATGGAGGLDSSHFQGPGAEPDRLLLAAAIMSVTPILLAFALSWAELAKLFMMNRYNYVALPYMLLAWVGLARRAREPRLRWALLLFPLLPALAGLPYNLNGRFAGIPELNCFVELAQPGDGPETLYLSDAELFPWMAAPSWARVEPFVELLEGESTNDEPVWVGLHYISHYMLQRPGTDVLAASLQLTGEAVPLNLNNANPFGPCWPWSRAWMVPPGAVPLVRENYTLLRTRLEQLRAAPPGVQRLLPDAGAFYGAAHGFSVLEFDDGLTPFRWTEGPEQRLSWPGPDAPGDYTLRVNFWRPHALPEETLEIRYRLPGGAEELRREFEGTGSVVIDGPVRVTKPGQRLTLEMTIPPWNTNPVRGDDPRELGLIFMYLELVPVAGQ